MIFGNILATALALAVRQAAGHLIMMEPHPYNLDTEPMIQTSPLGESFPFPCQNRFQHAEQTTKMTAGSTTTVKFWGSAVHGGGSCQFSVAYGDTPPSDPTKWKTIYSLIGGCPAEAQGNIATAGTDPQGRPGGTECGNDSGTECLRQFQVPIPKDMKNGPAVFAWTWFNKVGNREMYMNCAPIEVVGGTDDSTFVDSLPAIFRANIPGECTTGSSGSIIGFPEPGDFGKVYEDITPNSQGSCEAPAEPAFKDTTGGDAQSPAPSETGSAVGTPTATPSYAAPSETGAVETPTATPSSYASPSSIIPSSAYNVPTSTASPGPDASGGPTSAAQETPAASGQPGSVEGVRACNSTGPLYCFSSTSFGLCNRGWAVPQDVPAGTECVGGEIVRAKAST